MPQLAERDAPAASMATLPTSWTSGQIIAALLVIAALKYAQGFLAPLLIAVLVSVALAPLVRWLSRALPRAVSALLVVLGIVGVAAATVYALSDDAVRASQELPDAVREVRRALLSASPREGVIRRLQQAVSELQRTAASATAGGAAPVQIVEPVDVQWSVVAGTWRVGEWVAELVLLLFLVYFLLASGDLIKLKVVRLGGVRLSEKKVTLQMIEEITAKIGQFVVYQAWSGLVVGLFTWLCFWGLGVRYAALWGLAAGVLNCVPYFGPTVVMVTSAVAALAQFQSVSQALLVAAVSVVVTTIEGLVLAPLMLGRAARVNTVATFVALMFWGWLWGVVGIIIAVPMLMIAKTIADRVESLTSWSELLSDRERPQER